MPPKSLLEIPTDDIHLPDASNDWDKFKKGSGTFGSVYEVRIQLTLDNNKESTEHKAALKKICFDTSESDKEKKIKLAQVKREAGLVNQMAHDNVIQLFGICLSYDYFGILLELCEGGSLGTLCRSFPTDTPINLRVTTNWALQIATGMKYLVDRKFLHRDLKGANILVKQPACLCPDTATNPETLCRVCHKCPINKILLKITDFGFSKSTTSVGNSVCGTYAWLAPEAFHSETNRWSEFADVWSFGVVLWEILAKKLPHGDANVDPIVVALRSKGGQTLKMNDDWPQEWRTIMEQCWSLTPNKRPTFCFLVEYFKNYLKSLDEHQTLVKVNLKKSQMGKKKKEYFPMGRQNNFETDME